MEQSKINTLTTQLIALDTTVNKTEAYDLATAAVTYTRHLATAYRLTTPPQFHNLLVNNDLRKRGLCYHWSGDLYQYLHKRGYKTLCFYHAGSSIGSYLFEHNALVIVAKGQKFEEGIILDGWRNSGDLYFTKVTEDKAYTWKQRGYQCTGVFYEEFEGDSR